MNLEELLREENYRLKNEITDLKNVFDINRDILRLIAHHDNPDDHEHYLLIQIITKLTAINNEALLANLQLSHEKSVLKEENWRVNMELNNLQKRFALELETTRDCHYSTDPFSQSKELHPSIQLEPELSSDIPRVHKSNNLTVKAILSKKVETNKNGQFVKHESEKEANSLKRKQNRKYTDVESIKLEQSLRQSNKQVNFLRRYIQELESRLILFVKACKLDHEVEEILPPYLAKEREESRLIKYALKDIKVVKKNNKWMLKVNNRLNVSEPGSARRFQTSSNSWPKYKDFNFLSEPAKTDAKEIVMP